jgi:hypothetical protein
MHLPVANRPGAALCHSLWKQRAKHSRMKDSAPL